VSTRFTLPAVGVAAALIVASCSSSGPPPGAAAPVLDEAAPLGTTGGSANTLPPVSPDVATHELTFRVRVPAATPADEPVHLSIASVAPGVELLREQMTNDGDHSWSVTVEVPDGGLVRYAYDRWNGEGCCEERSRTREDVFTGQALGYRLLMAVPGLSEVHDVVAQWHDHQDGFTAATLSGRVIDPESGSPLMDVDVTAGGVHVATRFDGSFSIPGLPPGPHRVVARTVTGDRSPTQIEVDLGPEGVDGLEISMPTAEMVPVEFRVRLSPDTPDDSVPHIGGNLRQLGARESQVNEPLVADGLTMPAMRRTGDTASVTIDLPAGAYINYYYTLGTEVSAESVGPERRFRTMKVGDRGTTRIDEIDHWANDGWPVFAVHVRVPDNTTPEVPVHFVLGPSYPMDPVGEHEFVTTLGSFPPNEPVDFRISLGDDLNGFDGSAEASSNGGRTLVTPPDGDPVDVTVTRWKSFPDASGRGPDGGLDVVFRLSIPPATPADAMIRITGDRPALGSNGTPTHAVAGNPWLREATVHFAHDGPLTYRYTIDDTSLSSPDFDIGTDYDGQHVNDWVATWEGSAALARSPFPLDRPEWIAGVYPPDFWQPSFLPESAETFAAAQRDNADWVAISSVWSFGRIQPDPVIESRPLLTWTVLTPIDDLRAQAKVAHDMGLKVFLAPQQNPEVQPDWQEQTTRLGTPEWWSQWFDQARAQWMWNATVGEEIGAEMLLLPGYVFHVFPPASFFADQGYVAEFDQRVQDLISEVRSVYSGKILVSGSQTDYEFPALADYVGVTTYDLGEPGLPGDVSFDDLAADYGRRFADTVDRIHDRWGKPVMFYTIHAPSGPQSGDQFGELNQTASLEVMFREIASRPFVAGAFSWSFDMIGASEFETNGVRGRTAESVLAKWFKLLVSAG